MILTIQPIQTQLDSSCSNTEAVHYEILGMNEFKYDNDKSKRILKPAIAQGANSMKMDIYTSGECKYFVVKYPDFFLTNFSNLTFSEKNHMTVIYTHQSIHKIQKIA